MNNIKRIIKNILYGPRLWLDLLLLKYKRKSVGEVIESSTKYILSLKITNKPGFKFTTDSTDCDLYSTIYCICYLGLVGELKLIPESERLEILQYIQSKQCEDGLYRDSKLTTHESEDGQGWGWQHLLPHVLIALDYLNDKPKKPFNFIYDKFTNLDIENWVESIFFNSNPLNASNRFMNICIPLQYARDNMGNNTAGNIVEKMNKYAENFLLDKYLNDSDKMNTLKRSESVKLIYHLLPSILFDKSLNNERTRKIIYTTIRTQNFWGGFGSSALSNACEDMDSIYNLSVLSDKRYDSSIYPILEKAVINMQVNQNADGGFVYIKYRDFCYGQSHMLSSKANQSNAFATWFRVLSIAFATSKVNGMNFFYKWNFSTISGYQYLIKRESGNE